MFIDLIKIPFSYRGSYFVISKHSNGNLYLRDVSRGDEAWGELFTIGTPHSQSLRFDAKPEKLCAYDADTLVFEIAFESIDTLRIRCHDKHVALAFQAGRYDTICPIAPHHYECTHYKQQLKLGVSCLSGNMAIEGFTINTQPFSELRIERYVVVSKNKGTPPLFDLCVASTQKSLEQWLTKLPHTQHAPSDTLLCAGHVLWQNFVAAEGRLEYPALYMTKNWMCNIWSWDNYFSALGLCDLDPDAAFEQLMIFESLQDASGAFPDYANPLYASFACNKPPLLGWTYAQLMEENPFFRDPIRLMRVMRMAEKQVTYWLKHRMSPLGLPYYTHGNDSGWDNGSFYHEGTPVVTPDLTTYLILQCQWLAHEHKQLGHHQKSSLYAEKANTLLGLLVEKLWQQDRFVAIKLAEEKPLTSGNTLQALMPLLIAKDLPKAIVNDMLDRLKQFKTAFGYATEAPDSSLFKADGYWLGPIWAPTAYLFAHALKAIDHHEEAAFIQKGFKQCVEKSGFAENFNPLTGEGLVDTGFAWTASVYLCFCK